jgi:hypothetical protein
MFITRWKMHYLKSFKTRQFNVLLNDYSQYNSQERGTPSVFNLGFFAFFCSEAEFERVGVHDGADMQVFVSRFLVFRPCPLALGRRAGFCGARRHRRRWGDGEVTRAWRQRPLGVAIPRRHSCRYENAKCAIRRRSHCGPSSTTQSLNIRGEGCGSVPHASLVPHSRTCRRRVFLYAGKPK